MKASYSWLRALLPDLAASPRELAGRFTAAGIEAEALLEYDLSTGASRPAEGAAPAAGSDVVIDLRVPPGRADLLGHVGLGREAAALFELPWEPPAPRAPARFTPGQDITKLVSVRVDDAERCPTFGAAAVAGVTVGPSPAWLARRLDSLGVHPASGVDDVASLVMLEFGHPILALDLDRLQGGELVVRRAAEGETLTTEDGAERTLTADDLVLADAGGPVALAGVLCAERPRPRPGTSRVLIACAYFQPGPIARTARRHSLHTASSLRFERGVDHGALPDVLAHAASLVTHLAGGSGVKGTLLAGEGPAPRRPIPLREARIAEIAGAPVPFARAASLLARLGCQVHAVQGVSPGASADVVPPHHRPDLATEADLAAEIARVERARSRDASRSL